MTTPITTESTLAPVGTANSVTRSQPVTVADQTTLFDLASLLTILLIVILFHVLSPGLREDSPTGQAFKPDSLRRVVTVILAFLSLAIFLSERNDKRASLIRSIAGGLLALFTLYVASFVFLSLELATDTLLPLLAELGSLIGVIALWQPWQRIALYRKQSDKLIPPLLIFIGVLVFWELLVKSFDIQKFILPPPSVILDTFISNYSRLVGQGWVTFQNALWGFAVGCGSGILFGLLSARFAAFSKAMLPYAIAANSIPIVAFSPIMYAWFGATEQTARIAVAAILTFFPAMINTIRGLTSVDLAMIELMRSLAASELDIFRKVRLPVALPYIFNGLKIGTSLSMIGEIVAEYFAGPTNGLGIQIFRNATLIRFPVVWSEIIMASVLGLTFYFVVSLAERLVMPWHISFRPQAD